MKIGSARINQLNRLPTTTVLSRFSWAWVTAALAVSTAASAALMRREISSVNRTMAPRSTVRGSVIVQYAATVSVTGQPGKREAVEDMHIVGLE